MGLKSVYRSATRLRINHEINRANNLIFEDSVNKYVTSKINQSQFDALVVFTYNLGVGTLKKSTLLAKVNSLDETIPSEFLKYV